MPDFVPEYLINSAELLFQGTYERDGFDLIITGPNGEVLVVADYFAFNPPPNLMLASGDGLSPEMVKMLLHDQIGDTMFAGPAESPADLVEIGVVRFASGNVTRINSDGSEPLAKGDPVYKGDEIVVDGRGYFVATMEDGTRFTQGANSRSTLNDFQFDETAKTGSLDVGVFLGGFSYKSGKIGQFAGSARDHTKITTPSAVIGIRGSELEGTVKLNGETLVIHKSGILTVSDINENNPVLLDSFNNTASVLSGGLPSRSEVATPEQVALIQQSLPPAQIIEQVEQEDADRIKAESSEAEPEAPPTEAPPVEAGEDQVVEAATPDEETAETVLDDDTTEEDTTQEETSEDDSTDDEVTEDASAPDADGPMANSPGSNFTADSSLSGDSSPGANSQTDSTTGAGSNSSTASSSDASGQNDPTTPEPIPIPPDNPPVATDDVVTLQENESVDLGELLLANDSDPDDNQSPVLASTNTANTTGQVTFDAASQTVTYSADTGQFDALAAGETATDSFGYTVTSGVFSIEATVTVTIEGVNDLSIAVDDNYAATEGTDLVVAAPDGLLANDSDLDTSDVLTIIDAVVTSEDATDLSVNADGSFEFLTSSSSLLNQLSAGQTFTSTILYTLQSSAGDTTTASATVVVTGANAAPTLVDDTAAVLENATVTVQPLINDTDIDGDVLTLVSATVAGTGGTVSVVGSELVFSPTTNIAEGDSLTEQIIYTVSDGNATSTGTVIVTITGINDPPEVMVQAAADIPEISALTTGPVDITSQVLAVVADDSPGSEVTALDTSGTTGLVVLGSVLYSTNGSFVFLNAGESFEDSFGFTVTDIQGLTTDGRFVVSILGEADAPLVSGPLTLNQTEDSAVVTLDLLTGATDVDLTDVLSVTDVVLVGNAAGIVITGSTLTLTPNAYDSLAAGGSEVITVSYNVTDTTALSVSQTATVTITGVNDVPVVAATTLSFLQTDAITSADFLQGATDVDGDVLSISNLTLVAGDDRGVTIVGTAVAVDPSIYSFLGSTESESITYAYDVIDGNGGITPNTFSIVVSGTNDLPTSVSSSVSTNEDTPVVIGRASFAFLDADAADILQQVRVDVLPALGQLQLDGVSVVNGQLITVADIDASQLTFSPAANGNGAGYATISFSVGDGQDFSTSQLLTIDVNAINDVPVGVADSYTVTFDGSLTTTVGNGLLANDSDVDGDALFVNTSPLVDVTKGSLSLNADGTFIYSLTPGSTGTDTFTYEVSDGQGAMTATTVTLTIVGASITAITSGDFLNSANYNTGLVPGVGDALLINPGVTLDLTSGTPLLGNLGVDSTGATLNITGANLNVSDTVSVGASGALNVTSGNLISGASLVNDGAFSLVDSVFTTASLVNNGTLDIAQNTVGLNAITGSNLGTISIQGVDAAINSELSLGSSFDNMGMIELDNTSPSLRNLSISFPTSILTNSGTIQTANTGGGGGTRSLTGLALDTRIGAIDVLAGEVLDVSVATTQLGLSSTFGGAGTVQFSGLQTLDLVSDFTVGPSTGSLDLSGDITISGVGSLRTVAGGELILTGDALTADLANQGLLVAAGNTTTIGSTNFMNTGTITVRGVSAASTTTLAFASSVANAGLILLDNSFTSVRTLNLNAIGLTLTNTGTIGTDNTGGGGGTYNIDADTLDLQGGTLDVFSGGLLNVAATTTIVDAGTTFIGGGTVNLTGIQTLSIADTFSVSTATNPIDLSGTITISGGTLNIVSGTVFTLTTDTINSNIDNSGTLVITDNTNTVNSALLMNNVGGVISIRGTNVSSSVALTVTNGFANDGTIELDNIFTSPRTISLSVSGGLLTNNGTILTSDSGGGGGMRVLNADIINSASGTIDVDFDTTLNGATFDAKLGTIDVAAVQNFTIAASVIDVGTATTLTGTGTILLGNGVNVNIATDFTVMAATPTILTNGNALFDGVGQLILQGASSLTLTQGDVIDTDFDNQGGTLVIAGNTVTISGANFTNTGTVSVRGVNTASTTTLAFTATVANAGLIVLDNVFSSPRTLSLNAVGLTFTNSGTIGTDNSGGGGGTYDINADTLDLQGGTLDVFTGGTLNVVTATTTVDASTSFIGGGTVNLPGTQTLNIVGGFAVAVSTNPIDLSGTITISGGPLTIDSAATLTLTTDTIDSAIINNGTLVIIENTSNVGSASLMNNAGALISIRGTNATTSVDLAVANGFTNAGTIELDNTFTSSRVIELNVASGVLTNANTIALSNSGGGGGSLRLNADIVNTGTIDVNSDAEINAASLDTLSGTINIAAGQIFTVAASVVDVGAGTILSGTGTLFFGGGISVNVATNFAIAAAGPTVETDGGVLFSGAGQLSIQSGASLRLMQDTITTDFDNQGTLTVIANTSQITSASLNNSGTISIESIPGTTNVQLDVVGFNNLGLIQLDNTFTSPRNQTLSVTTGILTNMGNIATVDTGGGGGTFALLGDITNASGGNISATTDTNITGASFDNTDGLIDVGAGSVLAISSTVQTTLGVASNLLGMGVIDFQGIHTVTLSTNFVYQSTATQLDFSGDVTIAGAGQFNPQSGAFLTFTGDTIAADINNDGALVFEEGFNTISGSILSNTGSIDVVGTAPTGSAVLDITIGFTNAGSITLDNSFTSPRNIDLNVASGAITNNGSITTLNTGGGGGAFTIGADVINNGSIAVVHSVDLVAVSFDTSLGSIDVAASQDFNIVAGTTTLGTSTVLTGTGFIRFQGVQTVDIATDFSILGSTTAIEPEGDITFSGAGTLTIASGGSFRLTNDTISADLTVAGGAELIVEDGTSIISSTTLGLFGAVRVNGTALGAAGLNLDGGSTIVGFLTLDNLHTAARNVDVTVSGILNTNGSVDINDTGGGGGVKTITSEIVNTGAILVNSDVTFAGVLGNNAAGGTIDIAVGQTLDLDFSTSFTNAGSITLSGGAAATTLDLAGVTSLINTGSITGSGTVINAGVITGAGTFVVSPGASPGILTFDGGLNTAVNLEIELEGLAPGTGHDQFVVVGAAHLGSSLLDVTLLNGYLPEVGDSYVVFTADSIDGHFGQVSGLDIRTDSVLDIRYNGGDVILDTVATTLVGSSSDDSLVGSASQDVVVAGFGNDTIATGLGGDIIYGQAGNDVIEVDSDFSRVDGGAGIDRLVLEGGELQADAGKRIDRIEVVELQDSSATFDETTVAEIVSGMNELTGVDSSLVVEGDGLSSVTLVGQVDFVRSEALDTGNGSVLFDVYTLGDSTLYIGQSIVIGQLEQLPSATAMPRVGAGVSDGVNAGVGAVIDLSQVDSMSSSAESNVNTDVSFADLFAAQGSLASILGELPAHPVSGLATELQSSTQLPGLLFSVPSTLAVMQDALDGFNQYSEV